MKKAKTSVFLLLILLVIAGVLLAFYLLSNKNLTNFNPDDSEDSITLNNIIEQNSNLQVYNNALNKTDLSNILSDSSKEFTVFALGNEAFSRLEIDLKTEDTEAITDLLQNNIVEGKFDSNSFNNEQILETLNGNEIQIIFGENGELYIQNEEETKVIVFADIEADNGIIHVIDILED